MNKILKLSTTLFCILLGCATLLVAWQTRLDGKVIHTSLTRHVEQMLLERSTLGVVEATLSTQQFMLWISGIALLAAGVIAATRQ